MPRVLSKAAPAVTVFPRSTRPASPTRGQISRAAGCLLLLLLGTASGCEAIGPGMFGPATAGSGNIISQTRAVEPFQEVRLMGAADISHVMATETSCEIEADDNLVPLITSTVENGVLKIEFTGSLQPTQRIKIRLAGAPLQALSIAGSGSFTTDQVDGEKFEFSVAGAGDAKLAGQTQRLKVGISGSGKVQAPQLKADVATIQISGAGSVNLHVDSSLKVNISGTGSVKYSGTPQVSQSISGAGTVEAVEKSQQATTTDAGGKS